MPSKFHLNFMMCIPVPNVGSACHPAIVGAVVAEHRLRSPRLQLPLLSLPRCCFRLYTIGPCFARQRRVQLHMTTADAHVHAAWHTQTYALFHPAHADLSLQLVRALAGRTPRGGGTHSQAQPHSSFPFNVKFYFCGRCRAAAAVCAPALPLNRASVAPHALQRQEAAASLQHLPWGWGLGVWGLGFGVWGSGFGVWGLEFGVWGLGFTSRD